jgi:hypothetical protein
MGDLLERDENETWFGAHITVIHMGSTIPTPIFILVPIGIGIDMVIVIVVGVVHNQSHPYPHFFLISISSPALALAHPVLLPATALPACSGAITPTSRAITFTHLIVPEPLLLPNSFHDHAHTPSSPRIFS